MNMSFAIVTDTGANLPEEMIEKNELLVLSLSFFVDDQEYYSYEPGKKTDLANFYKMMREKKPIRTSLVNEELAKEQIAALLADGKDVLYIGFSSGLSGTFQSVSIAMDALKEEYPDRKILAVDTLAAALGQGLLVYFAIEKRREGVQIEEVYRWILENRLHLCHWFTVDDLLFLKRGGRISAATAVVGTALNIKPILHVDDEGHLINMAKARGRKKSLDALLKKFEECAINPGETPVFISHGDCIEDVQYVEQKLKEKYGVKEVVIQILDPVIGAHAGPGTVALFFFGTHR